MVLLDMHQPGVEARPLKQMTGNEEFGEVFLSAVNDYLRENPTVRPAPKQPAC